MIVLRIVAHLSNNDEIVRQVEIAHEVPAEVAAEVAAEVPPFLNSFDNVCKHISSLRQEIEERDKEISSTHILQVIVQSQHLHEVFSLKELSVVNMCGKIIHSTAREVHAPTAKPYVKKEKNNFGITDTVYTRFCNFHTGSSKTSTLLRGATSSKSIKMSIEHIFILDHVQDVFVTNIVYNARMGRAVSLKNSGIERALKKLNIGTVLRCMPLEECMFVHCFKVQILDLAFLRHLCMSSLTNCASVRVNICRTGVINFFVGLPGGIPLSLEPELRIMKLCQILLESILGST